MRTKMSRIRSTWIYCNLELILYHKLSKPDIKITLCEEKKWPPVWIHNPGSLVLSLSIELGRAGEARHHHVIGSVLRQPVLNITLRLVFKILAA